MDATTTTNDTTTDERFVPCESCAAVGLATPATTRSANPDWSGYELCGECAAEYDRRPPLGPGPSAGDAP